MASPEIPERSSNTNSRSPSVSSRTGTGETPMATPPTTSESSNPRTRNAVPESANLATRERTPSRIHESTLPATSERSPQRYFQKVVLSSLLTSAGRANPATSAEVRDSSAQRMSSEDDIFENLEFEEQVTLAESPQPIAAAESPEEKDTDEEAPALAVATTPAKPEPVLDA